MSVTSAILRATDGNLRADNWQYILEVCDRVQEDPEDGGEEAIEVIEERLEQKDANVILRTLSLIVSLAENCGSRLKQLISSKRFTHKLQSLVESRSVHITVKREVAKMVQQLSISFKGDPSLRYMGDLLSLIASKHPYLLVSEQPDVPSKKEMSAESKQKEEKELEQALKLSLVEYERQRQSQEARQPQAETSMNDNEIMKQDSSKDDDVLPSGPTVVKKVRAMYDLSSSEPDELSFKKGDVIIVLEQVYRDWWRGTLYGKVGIFPLNYVTPVKEPTQQERELEKQNEDALLGQKANVDKLHYALQRSKELNNGDVTQDPAINDLYGTVTPLRPQIAKSIGKYARKREDLASLREVLANAEATYNQLLDRATNAYTSPMPAQRYPTTDQSRKGYAFASEHGRDPHVWSGAAPITNSSQQQNYNQLQNDQGYSYDYRKSQVPMQYGVQSNVGQNLNPYNPNSN